MLMKRKGFTLIELLIVVAIIAILAAIAVPNFLEAQIRSKVSRIKADMRSIATAIESYAVDNNRVPRMVHTDFYPDDANHLPAPYTEAYGILWWGLTTPVAYITRVDFIDPFQNTDTANRLDERRFTYQDIKKYKEEWGETPFWGPAQEYYGHWRLGSVGPDKQFAHGFSSSAQLAYDPTNGTISLGNICRSQNRSDNDQPPEGPLLGAH